MRAARRALVAGLMLAAATFVARAAADKVDKNNLLTGQAAFVDYKTMKTGAFRKITVADLPQPFATESASNSARIVPRPADAWPKAPAGFKVDLFADGLAGARTLRLAPNGDLFLAETRGGNIKIFRGRTADGKPEQVSVFASGLRQPYGIALAPPGPNPQWLYVGNTNAIVRFPYKNGDVKASAGPSVIVPDLPTGGHSTRDIAFSQDGKRLWVAVGSQSNVDDPDENKAEFHRANILEFTPEGQFVKVYASGIRNPAGIGVNPTTGELWCSTNERDALGDNLVPDYITHVKEGGFYGWPWYYMGDHQDPRHAGKHPELKGRILVPDVLVSPHNASLGLTFYTARQFPEEYRGDLFAAEHGSWNRATRTGYEVVRVPLQNGHATGEFQDFLTGFVLPSGDVWGRPVGVAVGTDGSLFVSDDGSQSVWRVSYTGK
ncbi:MAG TPA: sorbosone dehydrogenase family protein [Vicinamibacterales bacterium]|nr:sorbosone dehydrogenase family protein [Vicinamibacterales bacterium]